MRNIKENYLKDKQLLSGFTTVDQSQDGGMTQLHTNDDNETLQKSAAATEDRRK